MCHTPKMGAGRTHFRMAHWPFGQEKTLGIGKLVEIGGPWSFTCTKGHSRWVGIPDKTGSTQNWRVQITSLEKERDQRENPLIDFLNLVDLAYCNSAKLDWLDGSDDCQMVQMDESQCFHRSLCCLRPRHPWRTMGLWRRWQLGINKLCFSWLVRI